MKIVEYSAINPIDALNLSLLSLDFAFTPERAVHISKTDPRPFPEFAVYAVEDDIAIGQVGVFRLPMVSTDGREDVGGIWAVCTHPQYAGRGVASRLLDEAHNRMRAAGFRFSTLSTDRYRVSSKLYQRHGYEDVQVWATALARWETAHQPTRIRAQNPGQGGYDFVEEVFEKIARGYLGFAWRYTPFAGLRDHMSLDDILILWRNDQPVGYALVRLDKYLLKITDLLLRNDIDAVEAVAAVAAVRNSLYIQIQITRPAHIASLRRAGFQVASPNWGAFMIKPLIPEVTVKQACQLFGIGTDRFLISWLDVT
jgi:GNAT superfamily N-acetyltransferase